MSTQKSVRLIDELGRIVLPIEVRKILNWGERCPVEIWVNAAGDELILKKHKFSCAHCGHQENLKEYNKIFICKECRNKIARL